MKPVVVHIPKSGGTTLVMNLLGLEKPPQLSFNYRHVSTSEGNNVGGLFTEEIQNQIIIMFRNPLERLESEFSFQRNRNDWVYLFNENYPEDFGMYVKSEKTHNSICKFLLGRNYYDTDPVTVEDYTRLVNNFEKQNLVIGIFEEYSKSLSHIQESTGISIPEVVKRYRTNLNKLARADNWETEIKQLFNDCNKWDIKLYEFVKNEFKQYSDKYETSFTFDLNEGHNLLLYISHPEDRCPITIFKPDSIWVKKNEKQFRIINDITRKRCLKKKSNPTGEDFADVWCEIMLERLKLSPGILVGLSYMDKIKVISEHCPP